MKPVKGRKGPLFWVKKRRAAAMNDTRFTQRAQEALRQAQQSAAQLGTGMWAARHCGGAGGVEGAPPCWATYLWAGCFCWWAGGVMGAAWPPGSCARPAWSTTPCGRR